jgi:hypothetical protein
VKVWVYHGDEVPHREQETERALARAHATATKVAASKAPAQKQEPTAQKSTSEPSDEAPAPAVSPEQARGEKGAPAANAKTGEES